MIKPISECTTLQELFADPTRWTQDRYAKTADGHLSSINSRWSVCFCLAGGIHRVYKDYTKRSDVFDQVFREVGSTAEWNDAPERTVEDVQKLCKALNI